MNDSKSGIYTLLSRSSYKNKETDKKLNSLRFFTLAVLLAIPMAASLLTRCSDSTDNHSFASSDEAIKAYSVCLSNLRQEDKVPIEKLATMVSQWQVMDDSVSSCLKRDTVNKPHRYPVEVYRRVKDSIQIEFIRMAASKPRSYHDLLYLKDHTSRYVQDAEIREAASNAQPFFTSLDSLPINNRGGKDEVMKRYRMFLERVCHNALLQ